MIAPLQRVDANPVLQPEDVALFQTTTDLRWRVTFTTVALLAQPIAG